MVRPDQWFARILVPIDDSSCAQRAFIHALSFAHAFRSEVDLLHVVEHPEVGAVHEEPPRPSVVAEVERAARRYLTVLSRGTGSEVALRYHTYTAPSAASAILQAAAVQSADLIVIGARGRCVDAPDEMGGTAAKIVRSAPCPVLTVGSTGGRVPEFAQRILVPMDFSAPSHQALRLAGTLAYWLDAELLLVHVVTPADSLQHRDIQHRAGRMTPWNEILERAEAQLHTCAEEEQITGRWRVLCEHARPADGILNLARRYDAHLIVQAGRGRSGAGSLALGSVASEVVRRAQCSVITVKNEQADDARAASKETAVAADSDLR